MIVLSMMSGLAGALLLEVLMRSRWLSRWQLRGIDGPLLGKPAIMARTASVVLASALGAVLADGVGASVTAAATAWLGSVAAVTDLGSRKIPKEACWSALGLSMLGAAASLNWYGLLAILISAAFLTLCFGLTALISRKAALGSGDYRLMLAFTPISAWTGISTVWWALLIAAGLQMIARPLLRSKMNYSGEGLPFGPALIVGTAIAAVIAATITH